MKMKMNTLLSACSLCALLVGCLFCSLETVAGFQVNHPMTLGKQQPLDLMKLYASTQESQLRESSKTTDGPVLNKSLVRQLALNQGLIGSTIFTGGAGYQALVQNSHLAPALWQGALGVIPLLALSQLVERSESSWLAGLNLSTNISVLRLFGARQQPLLAFGVSAFLAGLTGVVEETVFRGQLLPSLGQWASMNAPFLVQGQDSAVLTGAVLSTILFAIGHLNPLSLFSGGGKDALQDNATLLGYQLLTGGYFCTLYLTTGNLAVPILVHALYDFYTFFNTHLEVTSQMKYAEDEASLPSSLAEESKWIQKRGENFVKEAKQSFFLMDTDRNGVVDRKELRVALFSYGVTLSQDESEALMQAYDTDQSGDVDFGEFLEYVGPKGKASDANKQGLLGPV